MRPHRVASCKQIRRARLPRTSKLLGCRPLGYPVKSMMGRGVERRRGHGTRARRGSAVRPGRPVDGKERRRENPSATDGQTFETRPGPVRPRSAVEQVGDSRALLGLVPPGALFGLDEARVLELLGQRRLNREGVPAEIVAGVGRAGGSILRPAPIRGRGSNCDVAGDRRVRNVCSAESDPQPDTTATTQRTATP